MTQDQNGMKTPIPFWQKIAEEGFSYFGLMIDRARRDREPLLELTLQHAADIANYADVVRLSYVEVLAKIGYELIPLNGASYPLDTFPELERIYFDAKRDELETFFRHDGFADGQPDIPLQHSEYWTVPNIGGGYFVYTFGPNVGKIISAQQIGGME